MSSKRNIRGCHHNQYAGRRGSNGPEVTKNGKPFKPGKSLKIRNHSPDGFNWGYGGSGPAQLALAILLEEFGREIAQAYYQKFKFKIVAGWGEEWQIDTLDVAKFVAEQQGACPERVGNVLLF